MSKIIAIANQKGGVGKTTTAINLSACLAQLGQECLLIDMDPQGNSTSGSGINKSELTSSIYNVLIDEMSLESIIKGTDIDWLDIAPSNTDLAGAEAELVNIADRQIRLKNALEKFKKVYKYVIIDCPPSLGFLTINSLAAADSVLIPMQCEFFALEGLSQLSDTISRLIQVYGLELEGVVFSMFDARTNLANQVVEEVKKFFGSKVYETVIPRTIKIAEAPSFGKPITVYDPSSKGAMAFMNLAEEFLRRQSVKESSQGISK